MSSRRHSLLEIRHYRARFQPTHANCVSPTPARERPRRLANKQIFAIPPSETPRLLRLGACECDRFPIDDLGSPREGLEFIGVEGMVLRRFDQPAPQVVAESGREGEKFRPGERTVVHPRDGTPC